MGRKKSCTVLEADKESLFFLTHLCVKLHNWNEDSPENDSDNQIVLCEDKRHSLVKQVTE